MIIERASITVLWLAIFLMGCSGSGLESDNKIATAKVLVNAGADKSVDEQTTVTLSALASGQSDALIYAWAVTPNIAISHDDTSLSIATFTAPISSDILIYTFTVEVTDAKGNKGTDTVVYQVTPVNSPPIAQIHIADHARAGDNMFPAGYELILDASTSTDFDSSDADNPIMAYLWQQTAGEPVLAGISLQGDSIAFTTPILDAANSLTINLTVTDQEGATDVETVTLDILSSADTLPEVSAGKSHEVFSGEIVNLNGTASTTVTSSEPLVATWLNDSEQAPQIENRNSLQTNAIAPAVTNTETVTFTLRVEDNQGNSVDDSLTVTIKPLPTQPLNDTGVIIQATDSQFFSSYQANYPGQDGQRGQDVIHLNGLSKKAGSGAYGFDFTRLDAVGDEVDGASASWSCVRDNITGLIWESKTGALTTSLHSNNFSYSWYQSVEEGTSDGDENGVGASCSLSSCNTQAFITEVNTQGLCNFRDWRLPTHNELLSLVHFGQIAAPMIDANYFPNTTDSLDAPVWYWTQDSSADGFQNELAQNAWAIDFSTGNDNFLNKSTAARIRLVRAGR